MKKREAIMKTQIERAEPSRGAPDAAHTPGPWRVDPVRLTMNDKICPWIEALSEPYNSGGYNGFRTVAHVEGSTLGDTEANARLIAQAPTLLAENEKLR